MNNRLALVLFCVMVHSGLGFAPEQVVNDILDSTAFNVAMFAMGWAATRWSKRHAIKGQEPSLCLHWFKALAAAPLALLPPLACSRTPASGAAVKTTPAAADGIEATEPFVPDEFSESPLLPPASEDAAPVLAGLSSLLRQRIDDTAECEPMSEMPPWRRSCFHSKGSVAMNIGDYLSHIHWFFECSTPCLVLAMIYLDRILAKGSNVTLSGATFHRLFLASLLAALKFHDDDWIPYPNAFYAEVGSLDADELNVMEKQFCKLIDWHFYVRPEDFLHYQELITTAALAPSAS